ncbi:MAG: metal ABC transporter ATP-binding protein [Acidaminococcus sp.]|jgi:zinc transport system ATP-binding protein|nr:metal ABC transporter ATP-binding protein [Acidaminococcus sp.]MCI2115341.1 metal ABC transporter ATP-binding protein [Acidaminococcus sp.]MCI2117398.1 metal ABC transporter ATP-binding protein [Acidaminococcus sp.]
MISLNHIDFAYENGPYLLEDLTMTIHDGDYVAVVGENGSGKSTLIKVMLGLLKPKHGSIKCTFRRTAYVPQPTDLINRQFPITVDELLDFQRRVLKVKDKDAVTAALEKVNMVPFRRHLVGALSGGQFQRVLVAKALIGEPDFIILDEPSTGMDLKSQDQLYPLIHDLHEKQGVTIVTVEHNLRYAAHNASTFFHMVNGRGHFCTPEEYIEEYLQENGGRHHV